MRATCAIDTKHREAAGRLSAGGGAARRCAEKGVAIRVIGFLPQVPRDLGLLVLGPLLWRQWKDEDLVVHVGAAARHVRD